MRIATLVTLSSCIALGQSAANFVSSCACSKETVLANREGILAHAERSLGAASRGYDKALAAEPARDVTADERALIERFAPQIFTQATEPFALKDFAAVLHPGAPWIAYHLFWDDDIDFPNDNDPCDHEVVWVRLNEARTAVRGYYLYFHGTILEAPERAIHDAAQNGGRVALFAQWGKHGSLPLGWESMGSGEQSLSMYQRRTFLKLNGVGRDAQDSPLARGWPKKFEGSWEEFTKFNKPLNAREWLQKNGLMAVSCLNNAVLNRRFLRYNFAAKTEWPEAICEDLR
jgi:hypothetical protein